MKTVIITGTSRGIGHALAIKFLEADFKVIGTATAGKTDIDDPNFEVVKLDLTNPESISNATSNILNKTTQIDILINNSGINLEDWDVTEIDISILRKTLEVNLIGLIDFTERLVPKISKDGQIINVSSRLGSLTNDYTENPSDNPSYRISKTALNMYTKTLAARLKKTGVIVSAVHPGWVKTYLGGDEAPREPEEAAEQIFKLATSSHPTGKFWYDNKEFPW
jgi:NAD(P)-dependent dehydrogenase (short-subunit alcohol dehydrogenase family)